MLEQSGLPRVTEAAQELARYDRDAEFDFAITAAIDVVLMRTGSVSR
ncbi:hypothetical protein [Gordonia sp. NPDC003950]